MEKDLENQNNTESVTDEKVEFKEEVPSEILKDLEDMYKGNKGLLMIKGPNIGDKIILDKDEYLIGRDHRADIFLDDITISRRHALIERSNDSFKITDLKALMEATSMMRASSQ
jgi:pSer/pThr/pTyr-binding forkhead associated (FHA) protein